MVSDVLCVFSLFVGAWCATFYQSYLDWLALSTGSLWSALLVVFAIGNVMVALVLCLEVAHRCFVLSTEYTYITAYPNQPRASRDGKESLRRVPGLDVLDRDDW
ncbi:hypothetical protein RQP46_002555 [Phenoliferia psychrophenolica]